jgi:hypothetical protein
MQRAASVASKRASASDRPLCGPTKTKDNGWGQEVGTFGEICVEEPSCLTEPGGTLSCDLTWFIVCCRPPSQAGASEKHAEPARLDGSLEYGIYHTFIATADLLGSSYLKSKWIVPAFLSKKGLTEKGESTT